MTDSLGSFHGLDLEERPCRSGRSASPQAETHPQSLVETDALAELDALAKLDPLAELVAKHNTTARRTSGYDAPANGRTRGRSRTDAGRENTSIGNTALENTAFDKTGIDLRAIVEKEVVPRLHHAPRNDLRQTRAVSIFRYSGVIEEEVPALAHVLLANDYARARERVDALKIEGRSLAWLFVELLTPTADYLRDLWIDDRRDLADVTLALFELQSLARDVALSFRAEDCLAATQHRVLLIAAFGQGLERVHAAATVSLTAMLFRHAGWAAWIEETPDPALQRDPARRWPTALCDVAIVLAARDTSLDALTSIVRAVRRRSRRSSPGVMVGGAIFSRDPALSRSIGADMVSSGPGVSLIQANQYMLSRMPRASHG